MPDTILLALSSFRYKDEEVEHALGLCEEHGARLVTVFVVDVNLAHYLTGSGAVVGSSLREDLEHGITQEYERRAQEVLGRVCATAATRGVECETVLRTGSFAEEVRAVMSRCGPRVIVVTRAERPLWLRRLFGSPVDGLCDELGGQCRIDVV